MKRRKTGRVIGGIFLTMILAIAAMGLFFYMDYNRKTTEGKEILVEIPEGSGTKQIISLLKEKGVIRFEIPMYLKMYSMNAGGKIQAGSFRLNDGMSYEDLVKAITSWDGMAETENSFTIPEGYTAEMIAASLEKKGIMNGQDFLDAVKSAAKDFVYADVLPEESQVYYQLQGYLYPDTYYLEDGVTAQQLVSTLLEEFQSQFDESRQARAKELGMSVTEVLIRASMVQKETDLVSEYPIIAAVINNRIAKNMRLQFDSTVVYAMSEGKYGVERVMYSDLKYESPYNTYMVDGLPAGPICNPSLAAIDAVLYPDENNYLFFQTDTVKNDGSNLFFETYEEHLNASSTANRGQETSTSDEETSTSDEETSTSDSIDKQ